MRKPLLAGNWKMNCTVAESVDLIRQLREQIGALTDREVLLAPTYPALAAAAAELEGSGYFLAAQNLHWEDSGAFTGEVSGAMLAAIGCSHVIIGHSERRQYFAETDESVARKVKAALRHGLGPIVCVGETLEERESGAALQVIERQVRGGLADLGAAEIQRLVLAYEPVWAIGTGKVATPRQAQEIHAAIRCQVKDLADSATAEGCRILYGGSVKAENVDVLMAETDIDGALVGGASLKPADFTRIVRFLS